MSFRISSGSAAIHTLGRLVRRAIDGLGDGQGENAGLEIWPLGSAGEPALSDEARVILAQLRRGDRLPLDGVVRAAAETMYRSELARYGANLDLGLLGPRCFVPAIQTAIAAGRGHLWEIQPAEPRPAIAG